MPDIENSRKTAEKGAEWVTVKQPKNSRKNSRKTPEKQPKSSQNSCFSGVSAVFPAVFRLFTVTHSAPFSAVFRLFSMSGIWHLCRWALSWPDPIVEDLVNFGSLPSFSDVSNRTD